MLPTEEVEFITRQLKKLKCKSLAEYYKTKQWEETKRIRRTENTICCYFCGMKENEKFHLHHMTYERLGEEFGYDLQWLCPTCHQDFHDTLTNALSGGLMDLVARYLEVNASHMSLWQQNERLKASTEQSRG